MKQNLYSTTKFKEVDFYDLKIKLLQQVITTNLVLESSIYKESLHETQRKQNINQGLTNINDSCFEFFCQLERERNKIENISNTDISSTFFKEAMDKMLNHKDLVRQWDSLFIECDDSD